MFMSDESSMKAKDGIARRCGVRYVRSIDRHEVCEVHQSARKLDSLTLKR